MLHLSSLTSGWTKVGSNLLLMQKEYIASAQVFSIIPSHSCPDRLAALDCNFCNKASDFGIFGLSFSSLPFPKAHFHGWHRNYLIMVAQVFCLTSSGGLPLFVRKTGDVEALSFSYIASLNGVHMFAKSQGVDLEDTVSNNSVVCWKEYHNSVVLIGISSTACSFSVKEFLDSVFDAMVLCLGIDELTSVRNPERLKRELRVTYKLIDKLLNNLEGGDKVKSKGGNDSTKVSNGDVNDFVETILCQENQALQNCLASYLDTVKSLYGCMTIHGRLAVASNSWWELNSKEKKLLSVLISTLNDNTVSSDIPVFLPYRSPSVPFRFVTVHLLSGVEVSMLCGPNPSITDIEKISMQIWRPIVEILRLSEKTFPKNFPSAITVDSNILGFMLLNIPERKFVISRVLAKKEPFTATHQLTVLKTFYKQSVSVMLMCDVNPKGWNNKMGLETYWCSEYHKCHAYRKENNVLCVLYGPSVPKHTMRLITKQCFKLLLNEKHFSW